MADNMADQAVDQFEDLYATPVRMHPTLPRQVENEPKHASLLDNMADQTVDQFEDFYVQTKDTKASETPFPPEVMTMVFEEALLRGTQRCVFTRFFPGMRLCSADTVSTIADDTTFLPEDIKERWVFDTYVKASEPGKRG